MMFNKCKWLKIGTLLITLMGVLFFQRLSIYASSNSNVNESYSVKVQGKNNVSTVEREVSPNQTVGIKLILTNNSKQKQRIKVSCNTAFTGDSGNIQYNVADPSNSYFGNVNFNHLTTGLGTVELPANGTIEKNYTIKVPSKKFTGVIVGGFYVKQILNSSSNNSSGFSSKKASMGYTNEIAYAIPIVLKESNKTVHTTLTLQGVRTDVANNNVFVLAKIANITPTVFGQLKIHAKIIESKSGKTVFSQTQKSMSMAPLSRFEYHIPLRKQIESGKYILKLSASSGKRSWHFQKKFNINKQISNATNTINNEHRQPIWIWWLIGVFVLLLTFGIIGAYMLGKRGGKKSGKIEK